MTLFFAHNPGAHAVTRQGLIHEDRHAFHMPQPAPAKNRRLYDDLEYLTFFQRHICSMLFDYVRID